MALREALWRRRRILLMVSAALVLGPGVKVTRLDP